MVTHLTLFDTKLLATSYGLCNIGSRFVNICVPMIAYMNNNKTLLFIIIMGLNFTASIATLLLRTKPTN